MLSLPPSPSPPSPYLSPSFPPLSPPPLLSLCLCGSLLGGRVGEESGGASSPAREAPPPFPRAACLWVHCPQPGPQALCAPAGPSRARPFPASKPYAFHGPPAALCALRSRDPVCCPPTRPPPQSPDYVQRKCGHKNARATSTCSGQSCRWSAHASSASRGIPQDSSRLVAEAVGGHTPQSSSAAHNASTTSQPRSIAEGPGWLPPAIWTHHFGLIS